MACDLSSLAMCLCFLFCLVWAHGLSCVSLCHVLSCLLSWPRPPCYLIIGWFAPPVLPHYLPCLLSYLFSLCLQSCAGSLSYFPWCFQSSQVKSSQVKSCPVFVKSVFPHGVVFVVFLFYFLLLIKALFPAIESSLLPFHLPKTLTQDIKAQLELKVKA